MDLDGGAGFDSDFLTEAVNPPGYDPAERLVVDGQLELRYIAADRAGHPVRELR